MKREEIIKIFEENHIAEGNATINATKLAEIFTKHEADLLKEFVEWLKDKLDKQVAHLKNSDEFDLERSIGIHIVLVNLDNHLVKFLETKDERQSP